MPELTFSSTAARLGIDNTPDESVIDNLKRWCERVGDPLRERAGPLIVTSGYRSAPLNEKVGGASNSQHCSGNAVDLISHTMPIEELVNLAIDMDKGGEILADQIIHESAGRTSWLHISTSDKPRHQAFRLDKHTGRVAQV